MARVDTHTRFCSKKCQAEAYPAHAVTCRVFADVRKDVARRALAQPDGSNEQTIVMLRQVLHRRWQAAPDDRLDRLCEDLLTHLKCMEEIVMCVPIICLATRRQTPLSTG